MKNILCVLIGHRWIALYRDAQTGYRLKECSRCGLEQHRLLWSYNGTDYSGCFYFKGDKKK